MFNYQSLLSWVVYTAINTSFRISSLSVVTDLLHRKKHKIASGNPKVVGRNEILVFPEVIDDDRRAGR